jgi:hypothetical protein
MVLTGDDVVDLMGQYRSLLREVTILTCTWGTALDQLARLFGDLHEAARNDQNSAVWSLRRLSMSFRRTISEYSRRSSGVSRPAVLFCASSSTRGDRSLWSSLYLTIRLDLALVAGILGDSARSEPRWWSMKPRLIDLNRITSLSYITEAAGEIRVGALTRQRHLEIASILRETLPLIARATAEIRGIAVRNRGTIGGSLAHADPAAGARRILGRRRP